MVFVVFIRFLMVFARFFVIFFGCGYSRDFVIVGFLFVFWVIIFGFWVVFCDFCVKSDGFLCFLRFFGFGGFVIARPGKRGIFYHKGTKALKI